MRLGEKRMPKVSSCALVAASCVMLLSNSALATRVHYQESVSGDLPGSASSKTLSFDVGSNTVQGSGIFGDFDSFTFTIPVGDTINSETYAFTVTNFPATAGFQDVFNGVAFTFVSNGVIQPSPIDVTGDFTSSVANQSFSCGPLAPVRGLPSITHGRSPCREQWP